LNNFLFNCLGQLPSIFEIVNKDNRLGTLAMAINLAGLDEASQQPGSITVFAPSNEAFSKVPQESVERLTDPQNKNELAQLLSYHVIGYIAVTSSELSVMSLPVRLQTLTGDFITVSKQGNQLKINDASVVQSDIRASNGIVHIIDTVLIPTSSDK
jgi:uncharacterized surface protein with fasciclin (FAS1) repeats